jgi:hypothetical protein
MVALVASGLALLAMWIPRFVQAMVDYERYTGGWRSILDHVLTPAYGELA